MTDRIDAKALAQSVQESDDYGWNESNTGPPPPSKDAALVRALGQERDDREVDRNSLQFALVRQSKDIEALEVRWESLNDSLCERDQAIHDLRSTLVRLRELLDLDDDVLRCETVGGWDAICECQRILGVRL